MSTSQSSEKKSAPTEEEETSSTSNIDFSDQEDSSQENEETEDEEESGFDAVNIKINPRTAEYHPVTEAKLKDLRQAGFLTSLFLSLSLAGLGGIITAGVALGTGTLEGVDPKLVLLRTLLSTFIAVTVIFGLFFFLSWSEAEEHIRDIKGESG